MRQRTFAIVVLWIASALVLGVVGSADASLTSPHPSTAAPQAPRPTPLPAPGARPHPRDRREGWARVSVEVAGI